MRRRLVDTNRVPPGGGEPGAALDELVEVALGDPAGATPLAGGAGAGRVDQHEVEGAPSLGQAVHPVEGVAVDEVVIVGVEVVGPEVVAGPAEVPLAEVERERLGAGPGGGDGQRTGVGEHVEDGPPVQVRPQQPSPGLPLVEEQPARRGAGLQVDQVPQPALDDLEPGCDSPRTSRAGSPPPPFGRRSS